MRTDQQIDADFIRRTYRTSVIVWAIVSMTAYANWGWTAVVGLTIGTALALASLRSLEWAIRSMMVPGAHPAAAKQLAAMGVLKLFLIGAILAGVLVTAQRWHANMLVLLVGIVGGVFQIHLVILSKAIGLWLLSRGAAVTPADWKRLR